MCMYMNQFSNVSLFNECNVYTTFFNTSVFYCRFTLGFSLMKRLLLVAIYDFSDGNISVSQYIASIGRMVRE